MMHMDRIGALLGYCAHKSKQRMDVCMQQYDITQTQVHAMMYIIKNRDAEEINQKDIERALRIKPSTVNGIVERLEEKKLITRTAGKKDARCRSIVATEKGKNMEKAVYDGVTRMESVMTQGFTDEERGMLYDLLLRVARNLNGELEEQC